MSANACDFFLERHLDGSVAARVAMLHSHGEQTYAKLAEVVNRVGNYLLNLGVRPEQRIVLHLKDGPELVYFFLKRLYFFLGQRERGGVSLSLSGYR